MASTRRIILIVIALGGLAFFGANRAMSILDIKVPLSGPWKDRFQDIKELNDYAKTNSIDLSDVKIENKNIDGVVIGKGLFKGTVWKEVSAKKQQFKQCGVSGRPARECQF